VGRRAGVGVVVRQLDPGDEQQVVQRAGTLALTLELVEIRGVLVPRDALLDALRLVEPRVVAAYHVVRDAEHVEASAADEVDELAHAQLAVAPRRVSVELGKQRFRPGSHDISMVPVPARQEG
jgi:hypothetical protein